MVANWKSFSSIIASKTSVHEVLIEFYFLEEHTDDKIFKEKLWNKIWLSFFCVG